MAGTPAEEPLQFVCLNCYTISAGLPAEPGPDPAEYEPAAECGACNEDDFVVLHEFERMYNEQN